MKKFVFAIATGLGAYAILATSDGSLAAHRSDDSSGAAEIRDSRPIVSSDRTSARLLALDQVLYPEATAWDVENTFRAVRNPH